MRKLLIILGIPIDDLTMPEALDRLDEFVRVGRATGKSHQVATVNADFVVKALDDPELRGILQGTDMATADGMPLVWGARLLGVDLAGRVTGADMVPALAERACERGYSLYLLGAAPGVAARAAEILQARHPGLRIAGVVSPPYGSILEMDPAIVEGVRQARPDILLVAFGNPKQEKWISMHSRTLSVPVMIGIGGTLDFIAGVTRRAPDWMQRSGLEWLFRLVQEPKRLWRRYVVDLAGFGLFFVRQWWAMRGSRVPSTVLPASESLSETLIVDGTAILPLRGRLERGNQDAFVRRADEALDVTPYLILDMTRAEFLDSSAFGTLVGLTKRAREAGGEVWLAGVSEQVSRVITLLRLDHFYEIRPDTTSALAEGRAQVPGRAVREAAPAATAPQSAAAVPTPAAAVPTSVVDGPMSTVVSPAPAAAGAKADPPSPAPPDGAKLIVIPMPRRLDASTAPTMQAECAAALAARIRLILDFSQTVFLASAGMVAMVMLSRQAQAAGAELRIAGCTGDVLRTLKMTRLDVALPLFPDLMTARQ
jgi:N-acetylglucosaminyldiphosphoundecaprenol N-acetyl-beta-D-mannosaminyltransferase